MLSHNPGSWASAQALQSFILERFLPLTRMKELAASAHSTYINAVPYPHIVLDDFFDPVLIDQVLRLFHPLQCPEDMTRDLLPPIIARRLQKRI